MSLLSHIISALLCTMSTNSWKVAITSVEMQEIRGYRCRGWRWRLNDLSYPSCGCRTGEMTVDGARHSVESAYEKLLRNQIKDALRS